MQRFDDFVTLINIAYKDLQQIKSHEVTSLGLKGSHVMCLFYLGQNEDGLTSGELCERCREDKAAISRNLKALQEVGYATVAADNEKKYKLKNILTEKGREAYSRLEVSIFEAQNRFGKGISTRDREHFYKTLRTVVGNFDAFCSTLND